MRVLSLLVVATLALASCGRGESPPRPAQAKAVEVPPEPPKPVVCPLSGEERPPSFDVERPALAVKVDNAVAARPQAGLENADIVYEELAEGGITRFLAVYHCSDAKNLGPVRSARMVDSEILREYEPVLFAYSGANPLVLEKVKSTSGVVDLRHGKYGRAYRRVKGRPGPHDLFTSTEKIRELSNGTRGAPETGLRFAKEKSPTKPVPNGSPSQEQPPPGTSVSFSFAGGAVVRYAYDAASGAYFRYQGDQPHTADGGSHLSATNVVVLKVRVTGGHIRDAAGNVSPEISLLGSGPAIVASRGVAKTVKWERKGLSDHLRLVDADGGQVTILPGNTWIHLLPESRTITIE